MAIIEKRVTIGRKEIIDFIKVFTQAPSIKMNDRIISTYERVNMIWFYKSIHVDAIKNDAINILC